MATRKIKIISVGKLVSNSYENKIIQDYLKRLSFKIDFVEIDPKAYSVEEKRKIEEGRALLKYLKPGFFNIALDERGKNYNSKEFALLVDNIDNPINFIIGGAYGLSSEIKDKSNLLLSLSSFTMPHMLAKVVLVEQIYRAFTINSGHPYHK